MRLSLRSTQKGLSLVEFVILATTIAALARLAVPNFYEFRKRAADASAYAVYDDLKESLSSYFSVTNEATPTTVIFNQRGPGSLPSPFSKIQLSENIRVNYLITLHYPGFFDLSALEVSHDFGGHYYRMVWINNKRIEQVVEK